MNGVIGLSIKEVVVGNIGTVFRGPSGFDANVVFNTYVGQSKRGEGRAAGEPVTLIVNGEIAKEYYPKQENDHELQA